MEQDTATAVLEAVREGGFLEDGAYAHSENVIEEADYWITEAKSILSTGGLDGDLLPAVEKILTVGKIEFSPQPPRSSGGYSESDLREAQEKIKPKTRDSKAESKAERKHEELDEQVAEAVANDTYRENLPVPPEMEGEAEVLPRDLTKLLDVDVRRLSGEYNAFLARVTWLLAVELSDLANSETMRDAEYRKALVKASRPVAEGEKKLKDVIEAEANDDPEVQRWANAVARHKGEAIRLRALKDIYSGNIERLSREWTMRTDEYNRS